MSVNVDEQSRNDDRASRTGTSPITAPASRWMSRLAFDKVGAIYVWLAIIVVFSIWVPETFPNVTTAKQILNANAITALAALSVTIPLAARVFDLSFALNMTLCGVAVAHFVVDGVPLVLGGRAGRADRPRRRSDQRDRRGGHEDRLVHRHPRDRLPDPGADHVRHQRHPHQ